VTEGSDFWDAVPYGHLKENIVKILSSFSLKIIAIICMTVDHVGMTFFPGQIWLRVIGRITFPVMAFMISEGFLHTRNLQKYLLRMLIFACIAAVPFYLLWGWPGDVLFTYFIAIIALYLQEKVQSAPLKWLIVFLCGLAAIPFDWSIFGVLVVFAFYRSHYDVKKMFLYLLVIAALSFAGLFVYCRFYLHYMGMLNDYLFELGVFLALPLIAMYNGELGFTRKNKLFKYGFYVYYPLNIFVIWLVQILTG